MKERTSCKELQDSHGGGGGGGDWIRLALPK